MPVRRQTPWRDDSAILARVQDVHRRHLRGDTNVAIAAVLGVDERTVRRDIDRAMSLFREVVAADIADLRAQTVAELEDVRRRSIIAAEFDEAAERAVLYGEGREVQRDDKGSVTFRGNKAGALAQARQATMDKAKVLGLIVEKVSPTDADGKTLDLATLMQLARQPEADGADADR